MKHASIIKAAEKYARGIVTRDGGGHDWHHIERVRRMARQIAIAEKVEPFLPELMALLHELHDRKIAGYGQEKTGLLATREWLYRQLLPEQEIKEIMEVIENQSYSASGIKKEKLNSRAGQIMQDADRLDAIGAIGIARCFAYNGKRGNPMHDPAIKFRVNVTVEEYKKDNDTSINHFYEKLLKLKDLMNTTTGKKIAQQRHEFLKKFLDQFLAEWEGEK